MFFQGLVEPSVRPFSVGRVELAVAERSGGGPWGRSCTGNQPSASLPIRRHAAGDAPPSEIGTGRWIGGGQPGSVDAVEWPLVRHGSFCPEAPEQPDLFVQAFTSRREILRKPVVLDGFHPAMPSRTRTEFPS
jgi:hypothetical protein